MFKNSSYLPQLLEVWKNQAFKREVYEPFYHYSKKIWIIIKKLAEINNND